MNLFWNFKSLIVPGSLEHLQHLKSQNQWNNILLVQHLLGVKEITEFKDKPVILNGEIYLTATKWNHLVSWNHIGLPVACPQTAKMILLKLLEICLIIENNWLKLQSPPSALENLRLTTNRSHKFVQLLRSWITVCQSFRDRQPIKMFSHNSE